MYKYFIVRKIGDKELFVMKCLSFFGKPLTPFFFEQWSGGFKTYEEAYRFMEVQFEME